MLYPNLRDYCNALGEEISVQVTCCLNILIKKLFPRIKAVKSNLSEKSK